MKNIESQLAKIIEKALEVAEKTGEFVLDQAPDLIRQFILYHTVKSALYTLMSILLIFFGYKSYVYLNRKLSEKLTKNPGEDWTDYPNLVIPLCIIPAILIIAGLFNLFPNLNDLIFVLMAPKLYILEYFLK